MGQVPNARTPWLINGGDPKEMFFLESCRLQVHGMSMRLDMMIYHHGNP